MPRRGLRAERRAVWWYRLRGYRILATNAWAGGYELDVVVRRGRRRGFCEVKEKLGDEAGVEQGAAVAPTQDALYADIDLALSWSERELPERERTKHVHRLHPYLGKFIPQLVEVLLERYFRPGQHVLDPFAGSGTTLVQALEGGLDATGVDVAAFNCLLMGVKTRKHDPFLLEQELRAVHARIGEASSARP